MAVVVEKDGGGSTAGGAFIGLIVGAVAVAVAIVGFFMWDNFKSGQGAKEPAAIVKVIKK